MTRLLITDGIFGVLDDGEIPIQSIAWGNGLASAMQSGAIITTGLHYGYVNVECESLAAKPALNCDGAWEEIVEISITAPRARLFVESMENGPHSDLPMLSNEKDRSYRLRVSAKGRSAPDVEVRAEEFYKLQCWPQPPSAQCVLLSSDAIDRSIRENSP
ncbi:hypothetical protein [Streptomyces sp. NPDC060243]|uniref:hypothetical protein n=1 Tax=Streptomyces sp. NPDC060243 TaxID=3347081 RepID=UPI003648EF51